MLTVVADRKSIALDRDKMKRRREELNLTMERAAQRAGLRGGAGRWNDIESGRHANITLETLDKIAKALSVDARDLLK
jgi:transcriptional regulator with XRE-family HTH domain